MKTLIIQGKIAILKTFIPLILIIVIPGATVVELKRKIRKNLFGLLLVLLKLNSVLCVKIMKMEI